MGEILSREAVRRHVLEKSRLTPATRGSDLARTVEDLVAVHATDLRGAHLSLRERVAGYDPEDLLTLLFADRRLGRLRAFRNALHIVPRSLMAEVHGATLIPRESAALDQEQRAGLGRPEYTELLEEVLRALGPRRRTLRELLADLPEATRARLAAADGSPGARLLSVLTLGRIRWRLVRGTSPDDWRRESDHVRAFSAAYRDVDLHAIDPPEALRAILRRYFRLFGPASAADAAGWLGVDPRHLGRPLSEIAGDLAEVAVEGHARPLLMDRGHRERLRDRGFRGPPTVNVLPHGDLLLCGYRDHSRFGDAEAVREVVGPGGVALPAILVNGAIVGGWNVRGGAVEVRLVAKLTGEARELVKRRAADAGSFLEGREVDVRMGR